jgi:hypothetical protein
MNTVAAVIRSRHRDSLAEWRPYDAWLAGGTWLFSEPQRAVQEIRCELAMGVVQ